MQDLSVILFKVVILVNSFLFGQTATTREEVKNLPGFGPPPTKHWSGFIEVDHATGTNLFYYLVESQSDPTHDPLVWWMNGGPGASSLVGLFEANGPLLLNEEQKLMSNPYAWNSNANVLYVEFAAGIGYSYCANSSRTDLPCKQSSGECSPCISSDSSVVAQNIAFIDAFLGGSPDTPALFPEFHGRPFYLTGESYAGVYIPTLAKGLLNHYKNTDVVNLFGLWITDPCVDNAAQFGWLDMGPRFAYQKGLISTDIYNSLVSERCTSGHTPVGDRVRSTKTEECKKAWRLYDIALAGLGNAVHPKEVPGLPMYIDPLNAYGPSGGPNIGGYLTDSKVRESLHAESSPNAVYHVEIGNNGYPEYTLEYSACNLNPPPSGISMIQVYKDIVSMAQSKHPSALNLHSIVVCSGNIDPVVAMHGTENAISKIGFNIKPGGDRRMWFFDSAATDIATLTNKAYKWGQTLHSHDAGAQIGGFTTTYDTKSHTSFHFVTIRGSGHMTPAYTPQRSFHLYQRMLSNKDFSPPLTQGWDTASDKEFYAYGTNKTGIFTKWVLSAMSHEYIDN